VRRNGWRINKEEEEFNLWLLREDCQVNYFNMQDYIKKILLEKYKLLRKEAIDVQVDIGATTEDDLKDFDPIGYKFHIFCKEQAFKDKPRILSEMKIIEDFLNK
jgi:histidyl-tRNA synthetase